ncbi:MAG: hypothetical protein V4858_22220 [Pseudomonadota bacterium]
MISSQQWDWSDSSDESTLRVQIIVGMRVVRELRYMLLDAAYSLEISNDDRTSLLCVLLKSGFAKRRLAEEVRKFQSILSDNLRPRMRVVALESPDEMDSVLFPTLPADALLELRAHALDALLQKPKTSSKVVVVGMLLHRWFHSMEPVTVAQLANISGASLPTVYAALKTVDPNSLQRTEDRRLSLKGFTPWEWQKWLTLSIDAVSYKYVDRSGAPRSSEKLMRQFVKLGRSDVAVGGVLGAMRHFPKIDITGAPYLDLVVHGTSHSDLSFITDIDPGLSREDTVDSHPSVIVHFANRPHNLFSSKGDVLCADVLDCMVHMWEANMFHQIEQMINHFAPSGPHIALGD